LGLLKPLYNSTGSITVHVTQDQLMESVCTMEPMDGRTSSLRTNLIKFWTIRSVGLSGSDYLPGSMNSNVFITKET